MADFNMAANMYGLYPNLYNNQIALNDLTDMDLYAPMGSLYNPMMANPMMTMNGSIFGGGMLGGYPSMMGYPIASGGSATSYEDYYKNYEKYQDFMIGNQVKQQQKMRNADLQLNSPVEGVSKQASLLHEKIMKNEQQQIQGAYEKFKDSVRAMYGDASEEEISNRAAKLYSELNNGVSLTDDIRQYGRGSFTQGLFQTLTLGIADKKTAEENIAEMTGQSIGRTEKAKKIAGNVVGGAVFAGVTAVTAKYILSAFCKGLKNKAFIATLIGGIIGLGTAIATGSSKS